MKLLFYVLLVVFSPVIVDWLLLGFFGVDLSSYDAPWIDSALSLSALYVLALYELYPRRGSYEVRKRRKSMA